MHTIRQSSIEIILNRLYPVQERDTELCHRVKAVTASETVYDLWRQGKDITGIGQKVGPRLG